LNAEYKRILSQTQRSITLQNRGPITQVMESQSAVLGPILETIENTEKTDMKMG